MCKYPKSPFILATGAGIIAVVVDIIWLLSEVALNLGISTEPIHLVVRLSIVLVGLIISIVIALKAIKLYKNNGYIQVDTKLELCHRREKTSQRKRDRIFRG